jgi:hypothetical protein
VWRPHLEDLVTLVMENYPAVLAVLVLLAILEVVIQRDNIVV